MQSTLGQEQAMQSSLCNSPKGQAPAQDDAVSAAKMVCSAHEIRPCLTEKGLRSLRWQPCHIIDMRAVGTYPGGGAGLVRLGRRLGRQPPVGPAAAAGVD